MKATRLVVLAVAAMVAGYAGSALAKEKKITAKDLPAAVTSAFKAAYPNAVIEKVKTEVTGGETCYQIESLDGKTKRDLLYTKEGKAKEIVEAFAVADLPEAVKQALAKEFPDGKIEKAEKETREGKVQYEVEVKSGTKVHKVLIDEQGKVSKTEVEKAEKKAEKKAKKEQKEEGKK